jgi:hypothetical protein
LTEAQAAIDADEAYTEKSDEEKAAAVKDKLIRQLEAEAHASVTASDRRKRYEAIISKRTYYHVNPLDEAVLAAWHDYLDSEEAHSKEVSRPRLRLYSGIDSYSKLVFGFCRSIFDLFTNVVLSQRQIMDNFGSDTQSGCAMRADQEKLLIYCNGQRRRSCQNAPKFYFCWQ